MQRSPSAGDQRPDAPPGAGAADDPDDRPEARARGMRHAMRAFRSRDFSIFFAAGLVSNSGTWLQNITVPYVILDLTGSATWVGAATFCQFLPSMLCNPLGGSLADRFDRRKVLLVTQSLMALAALALWGVWASGVRSGVAILAVVAVSGLFSGLNVPSWQSFVVQLVPRDHLLSAITLNSVQFNAARAIGPAVAGLLLYTLGPGLAFLLNGLSFGAVILALLLVRNRAVPPRARPDGGVLRQFGDAIAYARVHRGILTAMGIAVAVGFLGNPLSQFAVIFAKEVFDTGALGVGILTAALGVGAMLSAPIIGGYGEAIPRGRLIQYSLVVYGASIAAFGLAPVYVLAVVALLFAGAGFLSVISSSNTAIQLLVDERMRGRVMALRVMSFTGSYPVGALLQGWLSDQIGPRVTVTGAGLLLVVIAGALATRPDLLRRLDAAATPPAPGPPGGRGVVPTTARAGGSI